MVYQIQETDISVPEWKEIKNRLEELFRQATLVALTANDLRKAIIIPKPETPSVQKQPRCCAENPSIFEFLTIVTNEILDQLYCAKIELERIENQIRVVTVPPAKGKAQPKIEFGNGEWTNITEKDRAILKAAYVEQGVGGDAQSFAK